MARSRPTFDEVVQPARLLDKYWKGPDFTDAWVNVQLGAALILVHHFFGPDWYAVNIYPDLPGRRSAKRPVGRHPLHLASSTGERILVARLVGLGRALKLLGFDRGDTNLRAKIKELKSDSYLNAYFELKIASTYLDHGFAVRFVELRHGKRAPDLIIGWEAHVATLDCKKRLPPTDAPLLNRTRGMLDRIYDAKSQIEASGHTGLVFVEVEDNLSHGHADLAAYTEAVVDTLPDLPRIAGVVLA